MPYSDEEVLYGCGTCSEEMKRLILRIFRDYGPLTRSTAVKVASLIHGDHKDYEELQKSLGTNKPPSSLDERGSS